MLNTPHFILRELTPRDATDLVKNFGNPDAVQFITSQPMHTLEQANEWLKWMGGFFADENAIRLAIVLKKTAAFAGSGGVYGWKRDANYASLGYNLLPDYRGESFAMELVTALVEFGWETLKLNRMEAEVVPGNVSRIKVLEKLGFRKEGLMRQRLLKGGKYYDVCLYGLLRDDYRPS